MPQEVKNEQRAPRRNRGFQHIVPNTIVLQDKTLAGALHFSVSAWAPPQKAKTTCNHQAHVERPATKGYDYTLRRPAMTKLAAFLVLRQQGRTPLHK